MTVVKEYIDRTISAKTDNHLDFQQMIKDSAKGWFDVVMVWKLDRFARNRYDSAHYKTALKKNGMRLISARKNIADGLEGIILQSILEGMAGYYSTELSMKVICGYIENALKCLSPLGPKTSANRLRFFWRCNEGLGVTKFRTAFKPVLFLSLLTVFQQIGQWPPKVSVVPLQGLDLVVANAIVGVYVDRYLVEILGAPPLEGH